MVTINLYGKEGCDRCEHVKRKLDFFLKKWGYLETVELKYWDLDTIDGMTEATYNDVIQTPTTVIARDGDHVAKWEGDIPDSKQLRLCIDGGGEIPSGN